MIHFTRIRSERSAGCSDGGEAQDGAHGEEHDRRLDMRCLGVEDQLRLDRAHHADHRDDRAEYRVDCCIVERVNEVEEREAKDGHEAHEEGNVLVVVAGDLQGDVVLKIPLQEEPRHEEELQEELRQQEEVLKR